MPKSPMTMPPLDQFAAVFFGGAVGSVARFLSSQVAAHLLGSEFPWGTLFVNTTGSLWLGYIATLALQRPGAFEPSFRLLLTTGFAGGYTTFSSFAYETFALLQQSEMELAVANVGMNLLLSFLCCWVGIVLAKIQG
jgi:fluoride exporter